MIAVTFRVVTLTVSEKLSDRVLKSRLISKDSSRGPVMSGTNREDWSAAVLGMGATLLREAS